MTPRKPRKPAGLGPEGAQLWREVTSEMAQDGLVPDSRERRWLLDADREADLIADLMTHLKGAPRVVKGSQRQDVAHPLLSEAVPRNDRLCVVVGVQDGAAVGELGFVHLASGEPFGEYAVCANGSCMPDGTPLSGSTSTDEPHAQDDHRAPEERHHRPHGQPGSNAPASVAPHHRDPPLTAAGPSGSRAWFHDVPPTRSESNPPRSRPAALPLTGPGPVRGAGCAA